MEWAGFQGSEGQLNQWLLKLKTWSIDVCRRRKRPDLSEDFEGAALEQLVCQNKVGSDLSLELERIVATRLELNDHFSTARDTDLGAVLGDFEGSFIESFVVDRKTENQEDLLISVLDKEDREEGKDAQEILDEVAEGEYLLSAQEERVFTLRDLFGYKNREVARFTNRATITVSLIYNRAKKRLKVEREMNQLLKRMHSEPNFGVFEIDWIRI